MIEPGKKQILKIERIVSQGAYLSDGEGAEVLLPGKQVPEGGRAGDSLEVFIYRDSEDRLIATVNEPLITVGELRDLKVKEITGIGAFLDMGLERDLLLPFKEQTYKVKAGDTVLVSMYLDRSSRLAATQKIYDRLSTSSPYKEGDEAEGLIYEISSNFGAFVAVDHKYSGLIPVSEGINSLKAGSTVKARVRKVLKDGKLTLSLRKKAYLQLEDDGEIILNYLTSHGRIPFTDKADPEVIREHFDMSKAAFKRAAGHLLKAGKIVISGDSITLHE